LSPVPLRQLSDTIGSTDDSTIVPAAVLRHPVGARTDAVTQPAAHDEPAASGTQPPQSADPLDETELLRSVFDTMRLLAAVVAVMFLGYTLFNLTRLDAPGVRRVMIFDQISLLVALTTFWVTHTRRIPLAWAHPRV